MTPAKKRRNNWIAAIFIISPFFWTIPTFLYMRAKTANDNSTCVANLEALGTAFLAHANENNGQLPAAANWIETIEASRNEFLHCPSDPVDNRPASYAMNANLSGKTLSEIKNPADVILLYETQSKEATPAGVGKDMVRVGKPKAGQGRHNTIAYRFNYFLMADGTVREAGTTDEMKPLRWTP